MATMIASGSADNTVRLWDTTTGESSPYAHWASESMGSPASHLVPMVPPSPAGELGHASVRLWDATTGGPLHTLTGHRSDGQQRLV